MKDYKLSIDVELINYALLLKEDGFKVYVIQDEYKKKSSDAYGIAFEKNGVHGKVWFKDGYSFVACYEPNRKFGSGSEIGVNKELTLENAYKTIAFCEDLVFNKKLKHYKPKENDFFYKYYREI